ncbi:MAG: hypothetical protein ABIH41_06985 [Nanoarchaeota archaeon]
MTGKRTTWRYPCGDLDLILYADEHKRDAKTGGEQCSLDTQVDIHRPLLESIRDVVKTHITSIPPSFVPCVQENDKYSFMRVDSDTFHIYVVQATPDAVKTGSSKDTHICVYVPGEGSTIQTPQLDITGHLLRDIGPMLHRLDVGVLAYVKALSQAQRDITQYIRDAQAKRLAAKDEQVLSLVESSRHDRTVRPYDMDAVRRAASLCDRRDAFFYDEDHLDAFQANTEYLRVIRGLRDGKRGPAGMYCDTIIEEALEMQEDLEANLAAMRRSYFYSIVRYVDIVHGKINGIIGALEEHIEDLGKSLGREPLNDIQAVESRYLNRRT